MENKSFEAANDFFQSLEEIQTLLVLAEEHSEDEAKLGILLKSALVMLGGKFEAFAEEIAEEFVFEVNSLELKSDAVPLPLKVHHTLGAIKVTDQYKNKDRIVDAEKLFTEIAKLWHENSDAPKLKIECKFNYGKHGENELIKLFWNIGIEDIFDYIIIEEDHETILLDNPEKVRIDFRADFNSLVKIRNNILHQDSAPELTLQKIQNWSKLMKMFAETLNKNLIKTMSSISPLKAA